MRAFVLSNAPQTEVAAATGGGVGPLKPADPFALAMAAESDPTGHVLVAGTTAQQQTVRTVASLAVARWPELRVAWRTAPAAALALAAAAGISVRSNLSPALAVHYFDAALAGMWSAVWMRSVARLHDPAPTLRQHLRSWLPRGRGYLVVHAPAKAVLALGSAKGDSGVTSALPTGARYVLLVGGDAPQDVTERVARLTGTASVRPVGPLADAKEQYGVTQAVEFVRLRAPDETQPGAPLTPSGECPACSLPLATAVCPFCHAAARMVPRGAS